MRSNNIRNGKLGIHNAQQSAKGLVRRGSDRPSLLGLSCAITGFASRCWHGLRDAFHPTATRVTTRVTGGACGYDAPQRSRQHMAMAMCRLAAR